MKNVGAELKVSQEGMVAVALVSWAQTDEGC
jgi:hypothetical protein